MNSLTPLYIQKSKSFNTSIITIASLIVLIMLISIIITATTTVPRNPHVATWFYVLFFCNLILNLIAGVTIIILTYLVFRKKHHHSQRLILVILILSVLGVIDWLIICLFPLTNNPIVFINFMHSSNLTWFIFFRIDNLLSFIIILIYSSIYFSYFQKSKGEQKTSIPEISNNNEI